MKQLFRFIVLIACSPLMACAPSGSSDGVDGDQVYVDSKDWLAENFQKNQWRWNGLSGAPSECSFYKSSSQDPFYCVQKACENAGGQFDTKTKQCDCNHDRENVLVFSPIAGGICLPPRLNEGDENANLFFVDDLSKGSSGNTESILKTFEAPSEIQNLRSPLFQHSFNHVFFETIDQLELKEQLLTNLAQDLRPRTISYTSDGQQQLYLNGVNESIHPLAIQSKQLVQSFTNYDNYKTISDDGCRNICYAEFWKPQASGYAVLRDLYVEGQRVSSKVFFTETLDLSAYYAMVTLDLKRNPNLIYLRQSINPSGGLFEHKINVFSAAGELVATDLLMNPNNDFYKKAKAKVNYPSATLADENMVTVCEYGTSPFSFVKNWERVVFGPYANDSGGFQGSVWGWQKNEQATPHTYSLGAYPHVEFGYASKELSKNFSSHHYEVMSTILSRSNANVTALDYESCLSSDPIINPLLREEFPGRVVNVSAFREITGVACQKSVELVKSTQGRILWVFAAGNDSRETCEQKMFGLPNVISVTTIDPEFPLTIEGTDIQKGKGWIDTASFRSVEYGPGTSYAAPVVAGLSAEIFAQNPHLSPEQVKKSLMLGVEFSSLPVTSGGRTHGVLAKKVAHIISENPNWNDRQILVKLYNVDGKQNLTQLQEQKNHLQSESDELADSTKTLIQEQKKFQLCLVGNEQPVQGIGDRLEDLWDGFWTSCEEDEEYYKKNVAEINLELQIITADQLNIEKKLTEITSLIQGLTAFETHLKWLK